VKDEDKTRRQEERKWEIKHRQLLTLGLDQITTFIYRLGGEGNI
jgi:hypothetical protein